LNFFSLGITAEALRANIDSKSAISLQRGPVDAKFHVEAVDTSDTSSPDLLRKGSAPGPRWGQPPEVTPQRLSFL